jgi:hypothetical protein
MSSQASEAAAATHRIASMRLSAGFGSSVVELDTVRGLWQPA